MLRRPSQIWRSNLYMAIKKFSKEKRQAMRALVNDRSIVIKKAVQLKKGSCVVVWDRNDYIAEGGKR